MNNKILGLILIVISLLLVTLVATFNNTLQENATNACTCTDSIEGGSCPHQEQSSWPNIVGWVLTGCIFALGLYLIFFEKSQKEIVNTLNQQKQLKIKNEKFEILLLGMSKDEQKVLKSIREQDGIEQNTLRLRTDLHKSKLSIILKELENKKIIKKVAKGKSNQVFIKIEL